jgi:predicted DNA-binding transcriptional regulator AlpA
MIKSLLGRTAVKSIMSDNPISGQSDERTLLKLLTVQDVAEILGCSSKQIYRYLNMGLLKECLVHLGNLRTVRFNPRKIMECIENGHFKKAEKQEDRIQANEV